MTYTVDQFYEYVKANGGSKYAFFVHVGTVAGQRIEEVIGQNLPLSHFSKVSLGIGDSYFPIPDLVNPDQLQTAIEASFLAMGGVYKGPLLYVEIENDTYYDPIPESPIMYYYQKSVSLTLGDIIFNYFSDAFGKIGCFMYKIDGNMVRAVDRTKDSNHFSHTYDLYKTPQSVGTKFYDQLIEPEDAYFGKNIFYLPDLPRWALICLGGGWIRVETSQFSQFARGEWVEEWEIMKSLEVI